MFHLGLVFTYFTILWITPVAQAQESSPWTVFQVEMAMADRLQEKVLDRILGPGQSAVFVSMDIEFRRHDESETRKGMGEVQKGVSPGRSGAGQSQTASQIKESQDSRVAVERAAKRLAVRVICSEKLSADDIERARGALKAALDPYDKVADIQFIPVRFRH